MTLDLRKLDHLMTVAAEGSFTRAAARLHMSQQALSTSIRALEREIGVPLLRREHNTVTPLPAGAALIADGQVLGGLAQSALRRVRQIGRGENETLRIGHTPAVTGEEITALLRQRLPESVHTEAHQHYPAQLTNELLAGELDVGLCRAMSPAHGLVRTTVTRHRLSIAVSREHRLAGRTTLQLSELSELSDERFVVWGQPGHSGYTDLLLEHCRDGGFEPRYTRNPIQGTPPVTAVIASDDVAFVTSPAGPATAADSQVHVIALEPAIYAPLHALTRTYHTGDSLTALLSAEP